MEDNDPLFKTMQTRMAGKQEKAKSDLISNDRVGEGTTKKPVNKAPKKKSKPKVVQKSSLISDIKEKRKDNLRGSTTVSIRIKTLQRFRDLGEDNNIPASTIINRVLENFLDEIESPDK